MKENTGNLLVIAYILASPAALAWVFGVSDMEMSIQMVGWYFVAQFVSVLALVGIMKLYYFFFS